MSRELSTTSQLLRNRAGNIRTGINLPAVVVVLSILSAKWDDSQDGHGYFMDMIPSTIPFGEVKGLLFPGS